MAREKTPASTTIKKRAPRKAAATTTSVSKPAKATKSTAAPANFVGPGQRAALIAKAAYFRAEKRGFAPGHETEDWLAAESEVDSKLMRGAAGLAELN